MDHIFEPANIDAVLGVFTKTLTKLDKRADWLAGERARLADEEANLKAKQDRHSVEQVRIRKARATIREIVGG